MLFYQPNGMYRVMGCGGRTWDQGSQKHLRDWKGLCGNQVQMCVQTYAGKTLTQGK